MEDRDSWMKKYINKKRLKFIENMITDLFIQGFPGLQPYIRSKFTCRNRYEGYFDTNSDLIDYIVKIDDFPDKFIWFCEKHDINAELVRIVKKGLKKYEEHERKYGTARRVSQNLPSDRDEHHRESLSQSDNEHMATLNASCNNIESTNTGSVSHEDGQEIAIDGENAACLVNCLDVMIGADATCPHPSYATEVSIEDNNFSENNTCREHGQFQVGPISKENTFLGDLSPNNNNENTNNNNDQSESALESYESFYLSSSDEENLFPIQSLEIDNLKLPSHLDEPVQRCHSPEVTGDNNKRVGHLETSDVVGDTFQRDGSMENTEVKFSVLIPGHSGIECQEDIDKFKNNEQIEKRFENNVLSDKNKKHEESILELTGSPSSLTDSILSETGLKEVNEMSEAVHQQQDCEENHIHYNSDDFNSLHITLGVSNRQESVGVARDSVESNSLHCSLNSFPASVYSESSKDSKETDILNVEGADVNSNNGTESSEGFEVDALATDVLKVVYSDVSSDNGTESSEGFEFDTLATNVLEVVDSDVESNNGSSDHVSQGSQSFERDILILEHSSTQIISIPSYAFSQNDSLHHNVNISEPSQHSSENSSQEGMQNNNSTPSNVTASNITVLVNQARRVIEMYFPELGIRL